MKRKLHKSTLQLLGLFILIPIVVLTVAVIGEPQKIVQFAQEFTEPPLYGCLRVGEGNAQNCASKLGLTTSFALTMHDRPLEKQATVYYGDRIKGSMKFTNVGDLPIDLKKIGLSALSTQSKQARDFKPLKENSKLAPQESVSINESSYLFKSPDPNKEWTISSKITTSGGEIPTADAKQKISVNASCTALRIKELTNKDKTNIKNLCAKNPKSKLCTSKQYCEIFNGKNCSQPNLYVEKPGWQCDQNVYLPAPEQELLEELCKVSPDTDACKKFCERSVGSSLCPKKYIVIDVASGKPVARIQHPKAVYIHDIKNFPVDYPPDYLSKGFPKAGDPQKPQPKVMGIKTEMISEVNTENNNVLGVQTVFGCIGTCPPPPVPPPPPPPQAPGNWFSRSVLGRGLFAAGNAITGKTCKEGVGAQMETGFCTDPKAPAPPPPAGPICDTPGGLRPAAGCPVQQARGAPGGPPPNEPSSLRSDGRGGFVDKNGKPVTPRNPGAVFPCAPLAPGQQPTADTPLCSNPNTAEEGDEGFAPECASGRRDVNPNDDPQGAPQHNCCLDAVKYVPGGGFCGRKAGAYLVPADGTPKDGANPCKPINGTAPQGCVEKDYFGKVCANYSYSDPDAHICKGADTGPDGRPRDPNAQNIIEPYQNTPEGRPFAPKDEKGFPRGTQNPTCSGPDRHTIALPDGPNGQKNGTCVLNTYNCPPGQYQPATGPNGQGAGVCTPYCTAPQQLINGVCKDPNAPSTGNIPDANLTNPPQGYDVATISFNPRVSPQEETCRRKARYYDSGRNECLPIFGDRTQCTNLKYGYQDPQSTGGTGTCKVTETLTGF